MFDPYRRQIYQALSDLIQCVRQKREVEQKISKLRTLVIANANMLPDAERAVFIRQANESFAGFTDSIREIFRTHVNGLTPTQVRDKLLELGFDLGSQVNPMASIHSVIRRLENSGEIEERRSPEGEKTFRLTGESLG